MPSVDSHLRHPLRHQVEQVRHHLDGRARPRPVRPGRRAGRAATPRDGARRVRLHHQRAAGRHHHRRGASSPTRSRVKTSSRSTAARCASSCPTSTSGRAPSGCGRSRSRRRPARLLGAQRLPHVRRPLPPTTPPQRLKPPAAAAHHTDLGLDRPPPPTTAIWGWIVSNSGDAMRPDPRRECARVPPPPPHSVLGLIRLGLRDVMRPDRCEGVVGWSVGVGGRAGSVHLQRGAEDLLRLQFGGDAVGDGLERLGDLALGVGDGDRVRRRRRPRAAPAPAAAGRAAARPARRRAPGRRRRRRSRSACRRRR